VTTVIGEIRDFKMRVWSRGLSVVTTKLIFQIGELCVPVSIGGVPVLPGDAMLADENGVLVLKPGQIAAAAPRAIQMQAAEGPRLAEVAKGARLPELNGTNARLRELLAAQAKD
jgi:regulator of RNase E activity RraA